MKNIIQIIFFILLIKTYPSAAQQVIFNKVMPPEGETFMHITGIVQDEFGYMWFASKKGLYRYDGYTFKSYKNNPLNPNSLASNALESLCLDKDGKLWIGTYGAGLDRFDPLTETFTHFQHDPANNASISNNTISTILYDSKGNLWVGSSRGLDKYDPTSGNFIHYRHRKDDPSSLSSSIVRTLYEDRNGTLWIGTGSPYLEPGELKDEGGLNRMDPATGKFIRYVHNSKDPNSLINNKVSAIFEDSKGNFWIGTAGDGLHSMNRQTGSFVRHQYDATDPEKLSRPPVNKTVHYDHISFINEDAGGAIWIGSSDAGINRYDPLKKKINHFISYSSVNVQIIGGVFDDITSWTSCSSRDGTFWISTILGNLFKVDPFNRRLPFHSLGVMVNAFYEDDSAILCLATNNGLYIKDSSNRTSRFSNLLKKLKATDVSVTRIFEDKDHDVWFCSTKGLYKFENNNRDIIHYVHDVNNITSLSHNIILSICEDNNDNLWVSTLMGLDLLNKKTGEFTHYKPVPNDTTTFSPNAISAILVDNEGKFWAGSAGIDGIYQFNPESGKFKKYIIGISVRSVYEDSEGILWVGADDGLYQYNRLSDIFSRFPDPSSSRPLDNVLSIIEDDEKRLWLGTNTGIIQLNQQRTQTTLYGKNYNINGSTLSTGVYRNRKGKLFFGSSTGYYAFNPSELKSDSKSPDIIFYAFRIGDKLTNVEANRSFEFPVYQASQIELAYNQNIFSLDFLAFDYANPVENRYLFMLENYDNSWHQAGSERRASYYKVPPGSYIFKVKAANSFGIWGEKSIGIIIYPPWWRTWWAYCLYVGLLLAGMYLFHSIQKQRVIRAERERNRERELSQAREIEKAYRELKTTQQQLIQSEKMASLGELTAGIAHEIQNPLNFVNNFSEINIELVKEMKEELLHGNNDIALEIAEDLSRNSAKINHHGKRADAIVKSMLQHSRNSTGQVEPTDINALCEEYLKLAYHGFRSKDKNFNAELILDPDKEMGNVPVIAQDIGRVLLNLYNNAFYAVAEKKQENDGGYQPAITVRTSKKDRMVRITVTDNGNGIPLQVKEKIFQPFFTTRPTGQGTGLGLSISYDIIKAHRGELKVKSEVGKGSEFTVELPV